VNLAISSIDAQDSSGIVRTASEPSAAPQIVMAASTEPADPAARQDTVASGTLIRAPDHSCAQLKQYCDGGSESATRNAEAPRHLHRRQLIKVVGARLCAAHGGPTPNDLSE
jgi:hypothetical protein